jgi:hypothetical protein
VKKKPFALVSVWGSKSRTARMQFVAILPARQVLAFMRRNRPYYACLQVLMPDGTPLRVVALSVLPGPEIGK